MAFFRKMLGGRNNKNKKRVSPSARTPDGLAASHPLYQYAMKEYAQTVPHVEGIMQEDGRIRPSFTMNEDEEAAMMVEETIEQQQQAIHNINAESMATGSVAGGGGGGGAPPPLPSHSMPPANGVAPSPSILRVPSYKSDVSGISSVQRAYQRIVFSPRTEYVFSEDMEENNDDQRSYVPPHLNPSQQQQQEHPYRQKQPSVYSYLEPPMPDSTYEEWYGDAYVGGPIKYIYPSGYQSMRPRSGPWKLSIVVCLLFTWLSIFVIGHCSDKAAGQYDGFYNYNKNYYNQANNNGGDDAQQEQEQHQYYDTNDIDSKWCGSVLLYWLWVISMLITGLATAYCSVIGYIKVRDFAVANSRSQPPGVAVAKSDYYVQISNNPGRSTLQAHNYPATGQPIHPSKYQPTIYQADGTPQFWGNQIYRPTQAAVAITSR
ncbi:hypothetical protein IV203_005085 [Nitzschia inconspicua]|uniref:Uncharacterized protein n=1 Tax=Nitzschia inconspicua TaxID=303405 RepID=A0A9K3PG11_9STRA|nr:hypothetical protein IV203_005085 [Nitzschia inconspicua]